MTPAGLPHSDIPGSMLAYSSPRLLSVNHVLLRLLMPRHPPYALIILTCFITQFVLKQIQIKLFFCLKSSLSKSRFLIVSYSLVKNCIFYLLLPSIRKISFFYAVVKDLSLSTKSLVEMSGIEPLTPCLQGRCSPS